MKPAKPTTAAKARRTGKAPSKRAIARAVASSTAIETGRSIRQIESTLRGKTGKLIDVTLAR